LKNIAFPPFPLSFRKPAHRIDRHSNAFMGPLTHYFLPTPVAAH